MVSVRPVHSGTKKAATSVATLILVFVLDFLAAPGAYFVLVLPSQRGAVNSPLKGNPRHHMVTGVVPVGAGVVVLEEPSTSFVLL